MTARERLVTMLRREAEGARATFATSSEMHVYADLCDKVAKEQAAIASAALNARAADGGGA